MEEEQRGEYQISLRFKSSGFPLQSEDLIGEDVGLDLLSPFPQRYSRSICGMLS
jgi:hypothetical protein